MVKFYWQQLARYFNVQPLRTRVLITVALFSFIYVIYALLFGFSQDSEMRRLHRENKHIKTQIAEYEEQLSLLSEFSVNETYQQRHQQHQKIAKELAVLDQHLHVMITQLTDPKQMIHILRDVIHESASVTVLHLRSNGAEPLLNAHELLDDAVNHQQVYKEGIELTFSGDFFSTLLVLKRIEALPTRFFWGSLNYEVTKYPTALVTLQLNYISGVK